MLHKKACRSRHAFFYTCLFFILSCFKPPALASSSTPCSVSPQQLLQFEAVKPHTLKDGDSLTLNDGREIRLIGINTPEIFKKSPGLPEPLAQEAKLALQNLLGHSFYIQLGQQSQDKYGRTLAYAYDKNGLSIEYQMLQQGLGFLVAYPPNLELLNCLRAAQSKAKQQHLGVWNENHYQATSSKHVGKHNVGFTRIRGKLINIQYSRTAWWLQLEGDVVLKIDIHNSNYFNRRQLDALKNTSVTVNGWMIDRSTSLKNITYSPFVLLLKHPAQLEINIQK